MVTSTKIYVSVVTLSNNDNTKCLENLKQGFKRTISWNKYRYERATQAKNNKDSIKVVSSIEIYRRSISF